MPLKRCPRCGEAKDASGFYRDRAKADGLTSYCRECCKRKARLWEEKNRERNNELVRVRRAANPEKYREQARRIRERRKQKISEYARAYYLKNRDHLIAYRRAYREAFPEKEHAYERKWRSEHPVEYAAKQARRRARLRVSTVERVDYRSVLIRDSGICHICLEPVPPDELHFDHVIPLAVGGPHTHENIRVSHALCNQRKWMKVSDA